MKENKMNNIFDLHKNILDDYKLYIDSFINIADEKILVTVRKDFDIGKLYPESLVQELHPDFIAVEAKRSDEMVNSHARFAKYVGAKWFEAVRPILSPDILGV